MMDLTFQLLTPGEQWPDDIESLAAAIRSQGMFQPLVHLAGDDMQVRDATQNLQTRAHLDLYPPDAYQTLLATAGYTSRMTDRDRDTALPLARQVTISTQAGAAADPQTAALFHATVSDGIWWLMGGFLVDPYRRTLWGWRRWRTDLPLSGHATELTAQVAPAAEAGYPDVTLYTLPYCPDCRDIRRYLTERAVPFTEVNLVRTPGAVIEMLKLNGGRRSAPTVQIGHQVLVDPAPGQIDAALKQS